MKDVLKYNSWKDLFNWLYMFTDHGHLRIHCRDKNTYNISIDGVSYFPISKRMAKKLIKEFWLKVEKDD